MTKRIIILTLTLATAYFVSDLPPAIDPQSATLHGAAALEAKEVPEGAILNIEPKSAEIEVPEVMPVENPKISPLNVEITTEIIEKAQPNAKMITSFDTVELSGKYKDIKIECINCSLNDKNLTKDERESSSKEVNVFLPGSGGGDNSEAKLLARKQMKNGIFQPVVGPIYPGWTNTTFGKTSTEVWNYREIKDLYAELFLKLKEKYGKIQVIGFSYGGEIAILAYLSLTKEQREGIRVLAGDPGIGKCVKETAPWGYLRLKVLAMMTPRYDGSLLDDLLFPITILGRVMMWIYKRYSNSWFDILTFPFTLPGRFVVWAFGMYDPTPTYDELLYSDLYGKQMDEMLAKEPDGSLDIQITGCGKKVSDTTNEELMEFMLPEGSHYKDIQLSKEEISRAKNILKSNMDGFCTEDVYRREYEEIAKKTLYPVVIFDDCIHSNQMQDREFWQLMKKRNEAAVEKADTANPEIEVNI